MRGDVVPIGSRRVRGVARQEARSTRGGDASKGDGRGRTKSKPLKGRRGDAERDMERQACISSTDADL